MKSLNLIGSGRVGQALARLWHDSGTYRIQDVLTTSTVSASRAVAFIGAGRAVGRLSDMPAADVWMLAVPDRQIATMAEQLAASAQGRTQALVFHCSGALTSELLAPLRALGWQAASAHCNLSFASASTSIAQFAGTPCGLEGDEAAVQALQADFSAIGGRCFPVRAEDKVLYHAAAVFASNFLPVLQAAASELWRDSGVPAELIPLLERSLLRQVADNVLALGPAAALTGPAARGDSDVVKRQGQALAQWDPAVGEAYRALSELARRLAQQGHLQDT